MIQISNKIKKQIKEGLDQVSKELVQRRYDRLYNVYSSKPRALADLEKEFDIKNIRFAPDGKTISDFKLKEYSADPLLVGEASVDSKTVQMLIDMLKKFNSQVKINLFDEYFLRIDDSIITFKNVDNGKKIKVEFLDAKKNTADDTFDIVEPLFVKKILDELDKVKQQKPVKM